MRREKIDRMCREGRGEIERERQENIRIGRRGKNDGDGERREEARWRVES